MFIRDPLDLFVLYFAWKVIQAARDFLLAHPEVLNTPAGLIVTVAVCLGGLRVVVYWCASRDE